MDIDVATNVADLVSFFLVTPDIIGSERVGALDRLVHWALAQIPGLSADPGEPPLRTTTKLFILVTYPFVGVFYWFALRWLLGVAAGASLPLAAFVYLLVALCASSVVVVALACIVWGFALIIGNRTLSRAMLLVGGVLFVLTRVAAILQAMHATILHRL
jgi:hypothetical protein